MNDWSYMRNMRSANERYILSMLQGDSDLLSKAVALLTDAEVNGLSEAITTAANTGWTRAARAAE